MARPSTRCARRTRGRRRRSQSWPTHPWTHPTRSRTRRMHWTALPRTHRGTSRWSPCGSLRTWPLENRLARHWAPWHRAHSLTTARARSGRTCRSCGTNRSGINRTRSRLRHDQPARGLLRNRLSRLRPRIRRRRRRRSTCCWDLRLCFRGWNFRCGFHLLFFRGRRWRDRRLRNNNPRGLARLRRNQTRCWGRRCGRQFGFGLTLSFNPFNGLFRRRKHACRGCLNRRGRCRWRLRSRGCFRDGSCRFGCNRRSRSCSRRMSHRGGWTYRGNRLRSRWRRCNLRRRRRMLLLQDCLQRIAGFGDVREVELRLQLVFGMSPCSRPRRRAISATLAEMRLHLLRLFHADGTGVSLLFCDADLRENVKNGFALDLQFSR